MTDKELGKELTQFVNGLLKKAKCNHAGNCRTISLILQSYLAFVYDIDVFIVNTKVKQGRKKINHYYLMRVKDGVIIDGTSSQFKNTARKQMPKVYIGQKPEWYL